MKPTRLRRLRPRAMLWRRSIRARRSSTALLKGINARYVKMFGFSADDVGIDSKELARWFIERASCTVGDDDVFVYTDGTADVFADSTSVPVYNFVSAVDDAARSLAAGSRTPTKQQVAAATETAKEHASSEYAFIMFSLVKTDAGWVLDEGMHS